MIPVPQTIKAMRIGVLYGGWSEESAISGKTGTAILNALKQLGLNAVGIEVTRDLPLQLKKQKINFCFIALHGKWGEDGTVQGLCEMMGIPYTGSAVLASAMAMNKAVSKIIFKSRGIPTAPFQILNASWLTTGHLPLTTDFPVVVKPVDSGSAIGVSIVKSKFGLSKAVKTALKYSRQVLAEKFISGIEVTAPVLNNRVLPLIEIVPEKSSFYDFKAKYVKGMSRHILPARVSKRTQEKIKRYALQAHQVLGCRSYSRVDFIVDRNGNPWILELNSIPGMTETSLFPESAKAAGLSFPELLLEIMKASL